MRKYRTVKTVNINSMCDAWAAEQLRRHYAEQEEMDARCESEDAEWLNNTPWDLSDIPEGDF